MRLFCISGSFTVTFGYKIPVYEKHLKEYLKEEEKEEVYVKCNWKCDQSDRWSGLGMVDDHFAVGNTYFYDSTYRGDPEENWYSDPSVCKEGRRCRR